MRSRLGALAFALVTLAVGLGGNAVAAPNTAPFYGCGGPCAAATPTPTPTPTPTATPSPTLPPTLPVLIPAAIIIQPQASALPDPGATPDNTLWQAADWNQQSTSPAPGCGAYVGPSNCGTYKYEDFAQNPCQRTAEQNVYAWQNANDENSFVHAYPGGYTSGNRYPNGSATPCPGNGTTGSNGGIWNPLDAGLASEINAQLNNTGSSFFPSGMFAGYFEDNALITGNTICGTTSAPSTTEFGSTSNGVGSQPCNQPGVGTYTLNVDYDSALGALASRLSKSVWMNGALPCCSDPTGCSRISAGHCHDPFDANLVDDAFSYHNICANAGGNLKYLLMENALMHKYNGSTWNMATSLSLMTYINSVANFVNDPSCNGTTLVDFEYGYGLGGPGDLTGGIAVRELTMAMLWLIPDLSTQIPDRVIPEWLGITCNSTVSQNPAGSAAQRVISNNPCVTGQQEVPYFEDETFVPYGPEHAVAPFQYNGSVQTIGGGCDGVSGDQHGASDLLVQCVGTSGIYCQQYHHLLINLIDYGPTAACVNTSATTEDIVSSWFTSDAIATYKSRYAPSGGDLTSVPYGAGSVTLPCTYTVDCTGTSNLASNLTSFAGNGTDTLCGGCGVVLLSAAAASPTPAPTPTPTPTPSPTPSPTPTPTPTATPGAAYTYHGCQVYNGAAGAADPIANAVVTSFTPDPNSGTIIANLGAAKFSGSDTAKLEIVNLANNATSMLTVAHVSGGHTIPITQNTTTGTGGSGAKVPWGSGFLFEGSVQTGCSGDCHWTTLNTDTCTLYEGGGGNFNGTTFSSYDGFIDILADSYTTNWSNKGDNWGVAGIGGLGFVYYGEDFLNALLGIPIHHPGYLSVPLATMLNGTNGVNISPGVGNAAGSCGTNITLCLELGDNVRLKASVTCPTDAVANALCVALKTYGAYVADTCGSCSAIELFAGYDTNGVDDTDSSLWSFVGARKLSDFDVMPRNGPLLP